MIKISKLSSATLIFVFVCGVIFFFQKRHHVPTTLDPTPLYRVATLSFSPSKILEDVENGFTQTISQDLSLRVKFDKYNANNSQILLRSVIEEILDRDYDLIFSLGRICSQTIKAITQKRNYTKVPIVFCAVVDPIKSGIVDTMPLSKSYLTGTASALQDYSLQIKLLKKLVPSIERITIACIPTSLAGGSDEYQAVKNALNLHGISVKIVEFDHINEVAQRLPAEISEGDMLMILRDTTLMTAIDRIIKICRQHRVPLFASDTTSVKKGAALGFGVTEYGIGKQTANHALAILRDRKNPGDVPITYVDSGYFYVNKKELSNQGLTIDPSRYSLIENIQFVE